MEVHALRELGAQRGHRRSVRILQRLRPLPRVRPLLLGDRHERRELRELRILARHELRVGATARAHADALARREGAMQRREQRRAERHHATIFDHRRVAELLQLRLELRRRNALTRPRVVRHLRHILHRDV